MSDEPTVKRRPAIGIAAVAAGAVTCVCGLIFISAVNVLFDGGRQLVEVLAPIFPIVLIISITLSIVAGVGKARRYGVIGGLLCLTPLLYMAIGIIAANS